MMADEPLPQPLISAAEIARRIEEMAQDIFGLMGADFLMVVLLKGGFVFAADLLRALGRHGARPEVAFYHLSSYGSGTASTGHVTERGPAPDVAGRAVLLVDDVLDTGLCASHALKILGEAGASAVKLCVLLDKPSRRAANVAADFVGFTIPDRFVVGYGIDHAERWRQLSFVAALDEEAAPVRQAASKT